MKIFPKTVTESIWRAHLATYSHTIVHNTQKHAPLIEAAGETFSPLNLYVCPLCADSYFYVGRNEILGNAEFSLDHLPPESVGGAFKVLTCKKCNNEAGHDEAELLTLITFGSIPDKRRNSILPYTYVINKSTGDKWPVRVIKTESKVDFIFDEKAKLHNEKLKRFLSEMHNGEHPQLQVFVGSPDLDKISRALLKSAYLICFVWWGYEFVFSKNTELIRKVFRKELAYPTRVPTVWKQLRGEEVPVPPGVSIVSKDGERLAFVVTIHLQSSLENFQADILIPNPTDNGWQKLAELEKFATANTSTAFEGMTIPPMVSRIGYSVAWNIVSWK